MTHPIPALFRAHLSAQTFKRPAGEFARDYSTTGPSIRPQPRLPRLTPHLAPLTSPAATPELPRMKGRPGTGTRTGSWLASGQAKRCSRRWGEMQSCGNLMKVRRHRERHRAAGSARSTQLEDPEAGERSRAVGALHGLERLDRFR